MSGSGDDEKARGGVNAADHAALLEQLHAARRQAAVGRLAGVLAHDFNNALTAVLGYCEMLLADVEAGHPWRADLQEIFDSGQRAALLTRQLLSFNRQVEELPQLLSWARLAEELRPLLRSLCGEVQLEVSLDPGAADTEVILDRGEASHVLFTLAWLARLGGGQRGTCRLRVTGGHAAGVGRDADVARQQVRFELPGTPADGNGESTGAFDEALRDLQRVVARTGGSLSVVRGTGGAWSGAIDYPVEGAPAARATVAQGGGAAPLRVLVADDEGPLRQVIRRMLERSGHTVFDAACGEEALASSERDGDALDLLITDVMMPGMNGLELAERLTARQPRIRVLYISGYTDAMSMVRRKAIAGAPFLAKPFTRAQLLSAIDGLVNRR